MAAVLNIFFWPALVVAGADWLASWRKWTRIRYFTKPAALFFIILWFTWAGSWRGPLFFFGLGLAASLAGDILLMLPDRFFTAGLVSFLLAHLCYIVGFSWNGLDQPWIILILSAAILPAAVFAFRPIVQAVQHGPDRSLLFPVMIYGGIITLMLVMALSTFWKAGWTPAASTAAVAGAALFWSSDRILAGGKFVRPVWNMDLLVMTTYHLGQFGIAFGSLMAYAS